MCIGEALKCTVCARRTVETVCEALLAINLAWMTSSLSTVPIVLPVRKIYALTFDVEPANKA